MSTTYQNKALRWFEERLPLVSFIDHSVGTGYAAPRNLNYWWNFGSLAGFVLVIMILSGIFLAMFYVPHTAMAFDSVERIMRDVNYGWFIRYLHANGASMFFLVVYIHMFRGLFYGSYKSPREILWAIGVIILFVMILTAFMGYVLPWGQMSFWAATVITSMASAIPVVGEELTLWIWGGFNVDNATLQRFFALHYLFPFLIVGLVVIHIWALHTTKSNNPLGIDVKGPQDTLPFHPYYTVKDLYGIGVLLLLYMAFVFFAPNYLGHPDNYIPADPLVTPAHIVPEWYFLPFYAILRAVPDKLGGVILMAGSVLILFVIPWLDTSKVRSCVFRPIYKWFVYLLLADVILLGFVGAAPAEEPWITIGQYATAWYFAHFLVIMPVVGWLEKPKPRPESISAAVLGGKSATAAGGA